MGKTKRTINSDGGGSSGRGGNNGRNNSRNRNRNIKRTIKRKRTIQLIKYPPRVYQSFSKQEKAELRKLRRGTDYAAAAFSRCRIQVKKEEVEDKVETNNKNNHNIIKSEIDNHHHGTNSNSNSNSNNNNKRRSNTTLRKKKVAVGIRHRNNTIKNEKNLSKIPKKKNRNTTKRNFNQKQTIQKKKKVASFLAPVRTGVSIHGIYSTLFEQLGGLIRVYANTVTTKSTRPVRSTGNNTVLPIDDVHREIRNIYHTMGCSIDATKDALLQQLQKFNNHEKQNEIPPKGTARNNNTNNRKINANQTTQHKKENSCSMEDGEELEKATQPAAAMNGSEESLTPKTNWIDLRMVIAKHPTDDAEGRLDQILAAKYPRSADGNGYLLPRIQQRGEGPRYQHEMWTYAAVPDWSIGRAYYFEVENTSPVPVSCAMTIDTTTAAYNVPIPAHSIRTIRPDSQRYFGSSVQWIILPSQRVKLPSLEDQDEENGRDTRMDEAKNKHGSGNQRSCMRYNGIRSEDQYSNSAATSRMDKNDYPDPSLYGWTFTGSCPASHVEFYEKPTGNKVGMVKLDWYYTTGTVKTVLEHPTMGTNQLFRRCSTNISSSKIPSELYKQILINPRAHTNIGYRRKHGDCENTINREDADDVKEDSTTCSGDDTGMNVDDIDDDGRSTFAEETTKSSFFPAKNDAYDFNLEGHLNRKSAIREMKATATYKSWEDAAREQYACVHAKFYISTVQRMYNRDRNDGGDGRNKSTTKKTLQPLPKMQRVIDVKSSERAQFSTMFRASSSSSKDASGMDGVPSMSRKANVRTVRIPGVNDEMKWKMCPLFERKLYYRPSAVLQEDEKNPRNKSDDDKSMVDGNTTDSLDPIEEEENDGSDDDVLLENYKATYREKLVYYLWKENRSNNDIEESAMKQMEQCQEGISRSKSVAEIESHMSRYYDWQQQQQWTTTEEDDADGTNKT